MTYCKVRFSKGMEHTAGLVLDAQQIEGKSIADLSRLFPISEANKMARLQVSPEYATQEEAFNHEFDERAKTA